MEKEKKSMIILEISAMIFVIMGLILYCMPLIYNFMYIQEVKSIKKEYIEETEKNEYQELYDELKIKNYWSLLKSF